MSSPETFGRICQRVCQEQNWTFVPSGVHVGLPDGRHQVVELEFFEDESEELVRLASTIGPAGGLSPERLIAVHQVNARHAHGALAVRDGHLVMVDTLLLRDAGSREIEASLRYLASTADGYEKTFYGTDEH